MSTAATRAPQPMLGGRPPVGRRVAARRRLAVPLNVTVLRSGVPDAIPGRSMDVCEGGIGAVLAGELFPGELVGVEFQLPRVGPVLAKARVCYQERLRCGLQFLAIPAEQKAMIDRWTQEGQENSAPPLAKTEVVPAVHTDRAVPPPTFGTYSTKLSKPQPSTAPHYLRRKMVMLLIASVMAVVGMGWWRWEQGWRELEAKLPGRAVPAEPRVSVPADVMLRLVTHRVEPTAQDASGSTRATGRVVLTAVIGSDGSVVSLRPVLGSDVLARAAMDAVQWWKFQPYQLDGQPVEVETTLAVDFP
jgi:hypothetical protein